MLRGFRAEHRRCYEQMRDGVSVTFPEYTGFGTTAAVVREMVSFTPLRRDSENPGLNRQFHSIYSIAGFDLFWGRVVGVDG